MNRAIEIQNYDRVLFVAVILLSMIGMLMVYSASAFWGANKYEDGTLFLRSHLVRFLVGFFLVILFSHIDYHDLRPLIPLFFLTGVVLLIVVLFLPEFHHAHRTIRLFRMRFQPSEFMKLIMVFYLAAVFDKEPQKEGEFSKALYLHYLFLLIITGLILVEPDLGSALVFFTLGFSLFFIAGVPWGKMACMVGGIVPIVLVALVRYPYQRERIQTYLNALLKNAPMTHQVEQAMIGLARGGLWGAGYGEGRQKFLFLPEPFTDFILAHTGEELGFIGLTAIFFLILLILWRGVRIACAAPDRFGFLLASGITSMILFNALINAGVIVQLLPTTGLPFPFVSYGGSNLLVMMMGCGILLNVSRQRVLSFAEFARHPRAAYGLKRG